MNRESIYEALKQQAVNLGVFTTVSRRLAYVEELAAELFPACYQNQTHESPAVAAFEYVASWHFDVEWYVYALQPDTSAPSSTILNPLIDAVLSLQGFNFQADGQTCTIMLNGSINTFEGLDGNRAVARVPLRILVPNY